MFDIVAHLVMRIEELERRSRRMIYFGTVTDVDHKTGLVRIDDGMGTEEDSGSGGSSGGSGGSSGGSGGSDDKAHKTDWLPWAEHAGKIKTRTMPSVGQTVTVFSPSGRPAQGIVMKGWYNENNKMPKAEKGEHVFINGTSHKQVITNGPEDKGNQAGDGSKSTAGMEGSPAGDEYKNQVAKNNIHQIYNGPLKEDEGSWGDGKTQTKPDSGRKKYTEHSYGDDGITHHAKDDKHKSTRAQIASVVNTNIDDKTKRNQNTSTIKDSSGSTSDTITPSTIIMKASTKVSSQSPRVEDVGKSYLGLVAPDQGAPPLLSKGGHDLKRAFGLIPGNPDPIVPGPGEPDGEAGVASNDESDETIPTA